MFECRKKRSIRSSRMAARLASSDASSRAAASPGGGEPRAALAGDLHPGRQGALKCFTDDGFASAVHGRRVDQIDAAPDRGAKRGRGLLAAGLAPDLAYPAAAKRKTADLPERTKLCGAHE